MKKVYSKPEIAFESFSLSQSIAAGCEITDPKDPALELTGLGFAFTSEANCSYQVPNQAGGDGEYNRICYHVSTEGFPNLFNS